MTTKKNSLLFKIKPQEENSEFNVNNFIDLFLEDGLITSCLDEVYGIATHNYMLKIYNVTFKETTPKTISMKFTKLSENRKKSPIETTSNSPSR